MPELVIADHGQEYHLRRERRPPSSIVARFHEPKPPYRPDLKGHVERFNWTIVHSLPHGAARISWAGIQASFRDRIAKIFFRDWVRIKMRRFEVS